MPKQLQTSTNAADALRPPPLEADADLMRLEKLAAKMSKKGERLEALKAAVGYGRYQRVLWKLAANRLLKSAALLEVGAALGDSVALATADQLVAVLSALPKTFDGYKGPCLLDGYPAFVDAMLMHAVHRAPELLSRAEKSLSPNIRRVLPFVRRRCGEEAALPDGLLEELTRHHLSSGRRPAVWRLDQGRLVSEAIDSYARARAFAAFAGAAEKFDALVIEQSKGDDLPGWNAEPLYLNAPVSELVRLLSPSLDRVFIFDVLERRSDPPDDLLALLPQLDPYLAGWLAPFVGARYVSAQRSVPKELAKFFVLRRSDEILPRYLAWLRQLPRDLVLDRVDVQLASEDEDERAEAGVGLAAHFDEIRYDRLLDSGVFSAEPGARAVPALERRLEACSEEERRRELSEQITWALEAEVGLHGASSFDEKWDRHVVILSSPRSMQTVLRGMSQVRRDAWVLSAMRACEGSRSSWLFYLFVDASDAALDEGVRLFLAKSDEPSDSFLFVTFGQLGARGEAALLRNIGAFPGARTREVVSHVLLSEKGEAHAEALLAKKNGEAPSPNRTVKPSAQKVFTEAPEAALVAGRVCTGRFVAEEMVAVCARIDALAAELGLPLVALPAGDFSSTGDAAMDQVTAVVGVEVHRVGDEAPVEVPLEQLRWGLGRAVELPWERIAAELPPSWRDSLLAGDVAVHLTATGPLAGAHVVHGILVDPEEQEAEEELAVICGQRVGQEPANGAVLGIEVAGSFFDDGDLPIEVDVSKTAHAQRQKKLGERAGSAGYFLIARYD